MSITKKFVKALIRRKPIEVDYEETKLNRCLSTLDLTFLGNSHFMQLFIHNIRTTIIFMMFSGCMIFNYCYKILNYHSNRTLFHFMKSIFSLN